MCNHYRTEPVLDTIYEQSRIRVPRVKKRTQLEKGPEHVYPKYPAAVILDEGGEAVLDILRWGVWPFYARDKAQFITNARSDGLLTKSTWKQSAALRRCVIPATGYIEPGLGPPGAKGEVQFSVKERPMFFFAGVWDTDPDQSGTRAFAMVTTEPNTTAARFHDRMPVVLDDAEVEAWLGHEKLPDDRLLSLCRGLPADALDFLEVAPKLKVTRPEKKPQANEQPDLFG